MKFINNIKSKYEILMAKKGFDEVDTKKITKRSISLVLSFVLAFSAIVPGLAGISFDASAEEVYFGENYIDGSTGQPESGWTKASDARYNGKTGTLGSETNPYIIKTGDEFYHLSLLVQLGNNFQNSFIDVTGLSATESSAVGKYGMEKTIDLRPFDGSRLSATGSVPWTPIGTSTTPFAGNIYSSTGVSIVNLTYTKNDTYTDKVYGVFGYNSGTIGTKGETIHISSMQYKTKSGGPNELDFTNWGDFGTSSVVGGAVAINTGTVQNVSFGTGSFCDAGGTSKENNHNYNGKITTPINAGYSSGPAGSTTVVGFSVGGVVGYNNGGTVSDCNFTGTIHSLGEDVGSSVNENNDAATRSGFGGIVGFSEKGTIKNSFSAAKITMDSTGYYVKVGGVVGNATGTSDSIVLVEQCVFTGSVTVKPRINSVGTYFSASVGGVVGYAGFSNIVKCVSSGNVTATYELSNKQSVSDGGVAGGIVGRASLLQQTTIDQCFSTGTVASGLYAGGIIGTKGYNTAASNNFSVATIRTLNNVDEKNEFRFETSTLLNGFGGLEGDSKSDTGKTTNSYFAGTTLSSESGSLFGLKTSGTASNVYYDYTLSPNRATTHSNIFDATARKSTNDFTDTSASSTVTLGDKFTKSADSYPTLNWVAGLDNSTDLNKTIKALSKIATTITFIADSSNSVSNNGEYSAYQMQNGKISSNSLINVVDSTELGITVKQPWTESLPFNGEYDTGKIGAIFTSSVKIENGSQSCTIDLTSKLIKAVSQTQGSANSISSMGELQALLDISRNASGAYVGSVFSLTNNIDGTLVVPLIRTNQNDNTREVNNLFCGELDGKDFSINEITAEKSFSSLFGTGFFANVHNLKFTNINLGTQAELAKIAGKYNGLIFSRSKTTDFSNLDFLTVNANLAVTTEISSFGMLTGYFETPNGYQNTIKNITFDNVVMNIPTLERSFSYGLVTSTSKFANDTSKSGVIGQILTDISVNKYSLLVGDYSTSKSQINNRAGLVGGLFGLVDIYLTSGNSDDVIITSNCEIKDFYADIDVYEYSNSPKIVVGFGGITSWSYNGFTNCHVTGKIIGPRSLASSSNTNIAVVGGIVGYGNKSYSFFDNSSYVGEIDGVIVGGLVGVDDGVQYIRNCYVQAQINADSSIVSIAKREEAGGLVGLAKAYNGIVNMTNSFFVGTVSGKISGGLVGKSSGGKIVNSYAKAILYTTSSTGSVGGLMGENNGNNTGTAKTVVTLTNSYFAGQLNGDGGKGGLIGKGTVRQEQSDVIKTSYFDKSIAGNNIPTIPATTETEKAIARTLDNRCAVESGKIKASSLNTSGTAYIAETSTNYPQLSIYSNGSDKQKKISNQSTQIVFAVLSGDFLTSQPNFVLNSDSVYSVERNETSDGVYSKWSDILTFVSGTQPYGQYAAKQKGNTYFTVNYQNYYGNNTLDMMYNINVKPFDYGNGTELDPYIIYDNDELVKYREYLKNGFDTATTYYKIGSVVDGVVVGDPITLDLVAFSDWEPIINATGHLDGNNSLIKNIACTNGYKKINKDTSAIEETYFGFFGSSTNTADIKNLTLDNVKIAPANGSYNIKAGPFLGLSSGGTFTNIVVTNSSINYSGTVAMHAGGFIGSVSVGAASTLAINKCSAYSEIDANSIAFVGGLIGATVGGGTSAKVNILGSAAYGSINNGTNLGGVIGYISEGKVSIADTATTVDITTATKAKIGGIVGFSNSQTLGFSVQNTFYGGRIVADTDTCNIGGMLGYGNVFKDYSDRKTFDTLESVSFVSEGIFDSDGDVSTFIDGEIIKMNLGNFYYNFDTNSYPTANIQFNARFKYYRNKDLSLTDIENVTLTYEKTLGKTTTGKSNTYSMTQKQLTFSTPSDWTSLDKGYFPRPSWLNVSTSPLTQRNETYVNDMSKFYSTAIYYTNAGKIGDEKLSNVFVTGSAAWSGFNTNDNTKITANGKMILGTGEGNTQNLVLTQTLDGYVFTKKVKYTPSVIPCGVADYSFFFANPDGMWVENLTESDVEIAYPWTLYTADQLRGIDNLLNNIPDENGLEVVDANFNILPPTDKFLGETFTLGRDVAGFVRVVEGSNVKTYGYSSFLPIGSVARPFNTTFNGLGHTVQDVPLVPSSDNLIGLFGNVQNAEISNLGIAPGNIEIANNNSVVGGIAGRLSGNSSIINCFSALSFTDKATVSNATVGGLVGSSVGVGNKISNSFSTGAIYLTGAGSIAGGLAGTGANLAIANSYVAGYVEAKASKSVLTGDGNGTIANCYYDIGATGNMANNNGAVSQLPTATLLGNAFTDVSGLYPLPKMFSTNPTDIVKISTIPVTLTNARSVTNGNVKYSGATINRLDAVGEYLSIGTITMNTDKTEFEKENTGIAFLGVNYGNERRTVIANLQCWYDAGVENGNKFVINTAKELAEFAQIVNGTLIQTTNPNGNHDHPLITNKSFDGWTVSLGSDIDLSTMSNWTSIGTNASPFKGTFDGAGHAVANFTQTTGNIDGNTGVFGTVNGGKITNVGIATGNSTGGIFAGGLVANSQGATIENCFNGSSVDGENAGGLIGNADGNTTILSSYNMGIVKGTKFVAGLVSINNATISNSYNTGIVQSENGTSAGIFATGSGSADTCYNASFVAGKSFFPVSPSGATNCSYDNNLLTYDGAVSGVSAKIEMSENTFWLASTGTKYPELKVFADGKTKVMQDASELSVLKMDFGSGKYTEFVDAKLFGIVTTDGLKNQIELSSINKIFNVTQDGDNWKVEPSSKQGSGNLLAELSSTVKLEHQYFAFAVVTMKVRYKFDFSSLFNGNPNTKADYHGNETSSTNTWSDSGTEHSISTADDLIAFANFANSNDTVGHTFVVKYSINMAGKTLPRIGSIEKPFNGTFDGGYSTISGLDIVGSGDVAMFGAIGTTGRVVNFKLDNFTVTGNKSSADMAVASVAANNMGLVQNIGISEAKLVANNASSSQATYLGTFVAKNSGQIKGCYFIQKRVGEQYGIVHSSQSNEFVGGMVGDNTGTITGSYIVTNMYTNNIKAIVGNNHGKTDNILNCYFNVLGEAVPANLKYAYDEVPWKDFYVSESQMKNKEFAKWLSSNLYAGTFEQGTVGEFVGSADSTILNQGLPYLALFQLAQYDIASYFPEEKSMMLSVWNITEKSNFGSLNGLFATDLLEYKYFKSIVTHQSMQFDMTLLQRGIDYEISTRVYGRAAVYNADVLGGVLDGSSKNARDIATTSDSEALAINISTEVNGLVDPNLIVATIKFKVGKDKLPWGDYREEKTS